MWHCLEATNLLQTLMKIHFLLKIISHHSWLSCWKTLQYKLFFCYIIIMPFPFCWLIRLLCRFYFIFVLGLCAISQIKKSIFKNHELNLELYKFETHLFVKYLVFKNFFVFITLNMTTCQLHLTTIYSITKNSFLKNENRFNVGNFRRFTCFEFQTFK